ncbi:hypothetical protein M0R19_03005 [Candidatus Pacearchaeota archaeon]|jgi:hypothetical protein|nr:hypothetical protein [Candidatus Pacearchaeota archaeon]
MKKRVVIESPFGGTDEEVRRNIKYARACIIDSLKRGEAPYASHLFFTQPGILDDNLPEERMLGINAGLEITKDFELTAIYCDLGISKGMKYGIDRAKSLNRLVEERYLGKDWEKEYSRRIKNHSHNGFFK